MWRSVAGVVVSSLVATGADLPPQEEAKRAALANFGAARLQSRKDNTPAAAKRLEAAAKLDPTSLAPSRELVSVYADLGRDAAAMRTARAVLAADPQDADTAHHLAKLLFEVKRFAEAADALAAAVDSPRLDNRATKRLAMRTDLARCRDRANDPKADAAWAAVRDFVRTHQVQLRKEGFTAAELDHEAAAAAEKQGQALVARKQYEAAADAFRTARDLFADPTRANDRAGAARLHRNLADLFAAKGDAAAAVKELEAYLAFRPLDVAPYERYAEQLRKAGGDPVAKLRAVAENSGPPAARWVMLLELARTPAGFAEANAQFAALAVQATDEAFFRVLVRAYATADASGAGLLDIAESIFPAPEADGPRKGATVPPKDAERRQAFAAALAARPDLAVKMAAAARLSGGTKRSPELWDLLAWGCDRAGKPDEVEKALRAAMDNSRPDGGFRAFQRLHRHLSRQRKWQEILDLCDSRSFNPGVLNFYRAAALAELGQAGPALRAAEKAENDNAFLARREKIHVLDILGRYGAMLTECDAAMAEFKTPAEVHSLRYQRAQAFLGLKRFADAEAELRGLLDDDPDDVLALNNLGYNLAEQNRKLDEAERMVRRAIEIDADERTKAGEPSPDHAAYLDSLGWVLFRKGKLTDARELLEKAVTLQDGVNDPTVWDHLGDAAFRQGDAKRAKEAWLAAEKHYATTHMGRQLGRRDEVGRKLKLLE